MLKSSRQTREIDHELARLARRQHGYVTRKQLMALGLTNARIGRWLASGRLIRVYNGVYALGHVRNDALGRAMAAVLACGPDAVLSHRSAAALWGFRKWTAGPIHVTAPTCHRRRGMKVHRCALTPREVTRHWGIRVTTPARTLLDIAGDLAEKQLIRAINDALISGYLRAAHLAGSRLERYVGEISRSPLEDDFRPWLKRYHLPEPEYNVKVNGREVDVYYPRQRLIVELDGWAVHSTKAAFEDDRERDVSMLVVGIATVRITRDRFKRAPAKEAKRLRAILESRSTPILTAL